MIGAFIVALSYGLLFLSDQYDASLYYWACSASYSVIAAISAICAIHKHSKLLLIYASVNLIAAILHATVNYGDAYELLNGILWNSSINLCLIIKILDAVLIYKGMQRAFVNINNMLSTCRIKHKSRFNSVV